MARIKERFKWKGMFKDVEHIVRFIIKMGNCIGGKKLLYATLLSYSQCYAWNFTQVSTCDVCQKINGKISCRRPELHPVPVHNPWFHVGIDFVGPISPPSKSGNSYILTLSDYFTKWVKAGPLPTKESSASVRLSSRSFLQLAERRGSRNHEGKRPLKCTAFAGFLKKEE